MALIGAMLFYIFYTPLLGIYLREECVCLSRSILNMRYAKAVGKGHRLGINTGTTYDIDFLVRTTGCKRIL